MATMRPADILASAVGSLAVGFTRFVTGVYPQWQGCLPEARQRIYFANHRSHGDFMVTWAVLPRDIRRNTRPVAALDYWGGAGLRGYLGRSVFNAVLIDRQRRDGDTDPVAIMLDALAGGSSLILFPEGTRNTSDEPLLPLRSGLFNLVQARPEIECVPVWIDTIGRVMPKGEFIPVPLLCRVSFGTPMLLAPGEGREAFLTRARDALLELRTPAQP